MARVDLTGTEIQAPRLASVLSFGGLRQARRHGRTTAAMSRRARTPLIEHHFPLRPGIRTHIRLPRT